ncbi:MAG: tetratricopeptide repeat protein [Gammaproteobacteria bacterium]
MAARADRQFEQRVAIKIMGAQMLSRDAIARFRTERQILANLSHRYIAGLIDGGTTDEGLPYLVMEYVVGVPIDRYCDDKRLSIRRRLRLFQKVCEAVDYAHRNLIVHRDLKPNNILVDEAGNPKLLDFGIAKLLDQQTAMHTMAVTREGTRAMTPEYASPEQVRGEPVSVASDVYSLGTLLYKILSGRMPFAAAGAMPDSLARAIIEQEPSRPSDALTRPAEWKSGSSSDSEVSALRSTSTPKLRGTLSGDLDNIVLAALRKDPERRYPSAIAFSEDIENFLAHRPVNARSDSLFYRGAKFVRRNAAVLGVATVVLILGMLSVAQIIAQRDRAELAANQAHQVSNFLTKLFENASPFASKGEIVSAVDLLEEGTREIEQLSDQPELQAELYRVMGESFSMLGNYGEAIPALERSRALHENNGNADTLDYADTLQQLGEAQRLAGDLDEAETNTRRSLAIRQKILGTPDSLVAFTIGRLGNIYYQKRDRETARDTLERALTMKRELGEEDDAEFADILGNLGITLDSLGEYDQAETVIEAAIELSLAHEGEMHPNTIVRISNLGLVYMRQGRLEEAVRQFERCLVASRKVWPANHPSVARNVRNLASAQKQLGNFSESITLYREAVEMARAHSGERSVPYVRSLRGLGGTLMDLGQYEEAERTFQIALAIILGLNGEDDYDAALLRILLGQSLIDQRRFAEAEPLLRAGLRQQDKLGNSTRLAARRELAMSLSGQGKSSEADTVFAEIVTEMEKLVGPDNASLAEFLLQAAGHARRSGDIDEALALAGRALTIAREKMPPGNWVAAGIMAEYGRCLLAADRESEARRYLAAAHRDMLATFGESDPRVRELGELSLQ